MGAQPDLTNLFNPNSIAVIGASRDPNKIGYITVKNLVESGFKGNIYPVNPNATEIQNFKCYPDLQSLPESPELVIISLPAQLVLEILNQCVQKNAKNIVVFSAGFKEVGAEGVKLEQQLKEIATANQLNILGPNCLGFLNNKNKINATFAKATNTAGNLRFLSQSGALASSIFDWAESKGLGFSEFVTLGNKAVLNANHILKYWLDQDSESEYNPIGMYLESIADGKDFLELTTQLSKKHPLFILKPGKSWEAQRAMMSHTGSIAGADDILDAALSQAGVIRCNTIEELFNLSLAFSWGNIPTGSSVAVISNAGGPSVITSDAVEQYNLKMAKISDETNKILQEHLPREAAIKNPVDVLGDALADRYGWAMEAVLSEERVDSLVVILTPQIMTEIDKTAEKIGELSEKYKKPIICSFIGGTYAHRGVQILSKFKTPTFDYPDQAIYVLAKMVQWHRHLNNPVTTLASTNGDNQSHVEQVGKTNEIIKKAKNNRKETLTTEEATKILEIWDIAIPARKLITNANEAKDFANEVGWPVVLKVSANKILHKTDVGGVVIDIHDEKQLAESFENLKKLSVELQIQKQVKNGIELIIGTKTDSVFGKALLFGIGGTLVEVLKDKNLAVSPIDAEHIREIVRKSKVNVLLKGYRGSNSINFEDLYALIAKVAKIAESIDGIYEFEINPVIASKDGIWAIDARVVLT